MAGILTGGQHCYKSLEDMRTAMDEMIMNISQKLNSLCENVGISLKASSRNLTELQQKADEINTQLDETLVRKVSRKWASLYAESESY